MGVRGTLSRLEDGAQVAGCHPGEPAALPAWANAVLYADVFFFDGDRRIKACQEPASHSSRRRNGWGFVLRLGKHVFYNHGQDQVLPLAAFASFLPQHWLAFIDNQAGEARRAGRQRRPVLAPLQIQGGTPSCRHAYGEKGR